MRPLVHRHDPEAVALGIVAQRDATSYLPGYLRRDGHVELDLDALRVELDRFACTLRAAAERVAQSDHMAELVEFLNVVAGFRDGLHRVESPASLRLHALEIWHRHNSPSTGGPTS